MTRYVADACVPGNIPRGWLALTYRDGICATMLASWGTISSLARGIAEVGDVEPGNPYWPTWISWVVRMRSLGRDPTLYCCDDGYGDDSVWRGWRHADGVLAFARAGVVEPHWWVFNDNLSEPPAYAVAVQCAQNVAPGYDISIARDYWPGIDPPQTPPDPPPSAAQKIHRLRLVAASATAQHQSRGG